MKWRSSCAFVALIFVAQGAQAQSVGYEEALRAARVVQGLITPSVMDLEESGITRSRSKSIERPNPWQLSQAPNGLLNEKRLG